MKDAENQKQINQCKSEIIKIATKMIEDKIDLIEGCRKITTLQYNLDDPDDIFLTFRGIETETETFPIGSVRNT